MADARLAEQFRRPGRTRVPHLILHSNECSSLRAEGLDLGAPLLCGCVQRCVTLRLCLGSLDHQLGEIGVVASDQALLLADLSSQDRDKGLFLELVGDPLGYRRDRFGFALAGLLKALSAVIAQLGKEERAQALREAAGALGEDL